MQHSKLLIFRCGCSNNLNEVPILHSKNLLSRKQTSYCYRKNQNYSWKCRLFKRT